MKMTKAQLEKAIFETVENESLAGDLGVRIVANAFVKYAGIEIVPDPEPELPPRPWRLLVTGDTVLNVLDASGNIVLRYECHTRLDQRRFEALIAAYNAAGERKRIETERAFGDSPTYGISVYKINGELCSARSRNEAIGSYAKRHASDLGLEIVES